MKFSIPEISWHNRDPVLSVDFQPKSAAGDPLRLATGGTDSHVLVRKFVFIFDLIYEVTYAHFTSFCYRVKQKPQSSTFTILTHIHLIDTH